MLQGDVDVRELETGMFRSFERIPDIRIDEQNKQNGENTETHRRHNGLKYDKSGLFFGWHGHRINATEVGEDGLQLGGLEIMLLAFPLDLECTIKLAGFR